MNTHTHTVYRIDYRDDDGHDASTPTFDTVDQALQHLYGMGTDTWHHAVIRTEMVPHTDARWWDSHYA